MKCIISFLLLTLSCPTANALPASESPTATVPFLPPIQRYQPPPTINPTDAIFREQPSPSPDDAAAVAVPQPPPVPPIPLPPAVVTPPPNQDAALARQGYTQVTYYTCHTARDGGAEQCGWHVPIREVKGEGAAVSGKMVDLRAVMAVVGGAVSLFALGLL